MDTMMNNGESGIFAQQPLIQGTGTQERFVTFLDIMGFKDRVARNSHQQILEDLQQLSNYVSEEIKESDQFTFTMFSDSLIIFSNDVSQETFISIIKLSNSVVKKSISLGLPIKGAIAKGECTTRFGEKMLFFGQPIIDAFVLEEDVEMYNIVLHNTVETYATALSQKEILFDCEVKLKGGKSHHYVLAWFAKNIQEGKDNLREIRNSVSGAPRRYIDNTLKCIETYEKPAD
jgi:hypothetical protein